MMTQRSNKIIKWPPEYFLSNLNMEDIIDRIDGVKNDESVHLQCKDGKEWCSFEL